MPTFSGIVVEVETDAGLEKLPTSVDFEVFCARCNAGLCNQSDTRTSYRRRLPQVLVEPCEKCLERATEEAANKVHDELDAHISDLEEQLAEARE